MLNYDLLTPTVERAAALAISKFPDHHDINDVKQSLWVWALEKKGTVSELLEKSEGSNKPLVDLMVKVAMTYLKGEDAASYGYHEEDRFYYPADLIKSILEVVFKHEDWQSFAMSQDSQPRAKSEPALGGNNLASYADVSNAVDKLPIDYYNLIVWRYKYHYTYNQIGMEFGVDRTTAFRRHERAVLAIQDLLGQQPLSDLRGGYDGRTRSAVTKGNISRSSTAQTIVDRDYEGQ